MSTVVQPMTGREIDGDQACGDSKARLVPACRGAAKEEVDEL